MLQALELNYDDHFLLKDYCEKKEIGFLSTPFDLPSLDLLVTELGRKVIKIGSGDLNNGPLLYASANAGVEIILSTGMSSLAQIELSLGLLALGYEGEKTKNMNRESMRAAWRNPSSREILNDKVSLLHCVSNYPSSVAATNLACISTLKKAFGLKVGYSDHTVGAAAAIAAATLGACCIEKHLTLDKHMAGPDHMASSEPTELRDTFAAVREVPILIGSPIKVMQPEEINTAEVALKKVVAKGNIKAGQKFTKTNVTARRVAEGEIRWPTGKF